MILNYLTDNRTRRIKTLVLEAETFEEERILGALFSVALDNTLRLEIVDEEVMEPIMGFKLCSGDQAAQDP